MMTGSTLLTKSSKGHAHQKIAWLNKCDQYGRKFQETRESSVIDRGLYAYVSTPYTSSGEINWNVLSTYVEQVVNAEVNGITCLASTCEGPYLLPDEREQVLREISRVVDKRVNLNVGVAGVSTKETLKNAEMAVANGATSLMVEMRQYFSVGFDDVYRHYSAISEIGVPIRLYNLPAATGLDLSPRRICELSAIEMITSVKEASGETERIGQIVDLCGSELAVFCGFHYQALEGVQQGASGLEMMMHPVIAPELVRLYKELDRDPFSEESLKLFDGFREIFALFRFFGVPQVIKAIAERTDLPFGEPRAPMGRLNDKEKKLVFNAFQRWKDLET